MGKKSDFEQRLYDDFFSSQVYRSLRRAGGVIGKLVDKGLDDLEKSDFYQKATAERAGRDYVDVDAAETREQPAATKKEKNVKQEQPAPTPEQPPMKEVRVPSNMPYYMLGLTWILYALLPMPMYRLSDYLITAGASLVVFGISKLLFKGKKVYVPDDTPQQEPEPQPEFASTGDAAADRVIQAGEEYLRKLAEADIRIENESVSASIRRMEAACDSIFDAIRAHPSKAGQVRKFMNYYLPTTMKLLDTYDRLEDQRVQGDNITGTMFDIEGMMATIATAFEKQLDNLYQNEAMDVSADIAVLETMLRQEGLAGEEELKRG